jgi:hypothetical protein
VRAVHKLLGVLTIWGEEHLGRGWGWRELKEANNPPKIDKISTINRWFPRLIDIKIAENTIFFIIKSRNNIYL